MKQTHTQKGNREPQTTHKVSDFPPKYDGGYSANSSSEQDIQLEHRVENWPRIPRNGPKGPILGAILAIIMTGLLILWFLVGFIQFLHDGSTKILELSTIPVSAFAIALGYKQFEMSKGRMGRLPLPMPPSLNSTDAEPTPQEEG